MKAEPSLLGERVLIHTPFGRDGALICEMLGRAAIQCIICVDGAALRSAIEEGGALAIIADEALRAGAVHDLAEQLNKQASWSDFPLLILTSGGGETVGSRSRLHLLEPLGNVTLLERPLRPVTLISSVRSALRARQRQYQIRDYVEQRERDEKLLRESDTRFRLAQNAGRLGSFEWDMREDYILWSPELEALYGLPAGAFEGAYSDWAKHVVPADAEQVGAIIQDGIRQKQSEFGYEFRAILPDGSHRWLRGRSKVFYSSDGTPINMVGVNIDVDDAKRSEAKLLEQWNTFDKALSNNPDFTYILSSEGRFTYANQALLALYQKPFEEVSGKTFFDLGYPPALALRLSQQIQQVFETRQLVRDQTDFTGPNGETRQYEYIFSPVVSSSGAIEAVAGSTRDITERMQSEQELRASEQRFRTIVEANPFGLLIGEPSGRLLYCNPAILSMLGYTEDDVTAGRMRWDELTPPHLAYRDAQALAEIAETGTCKPYEKIYIARDGHHIPILLAASAFTMQSGQAAIAAFVTDLSVLKETEQKRTQTLEALQSANESLKRANSGLEEFAYVASHDIQEPLRMVNSYTQLLLRRHINQDNLEAREYGTFVVEGVRRIERLIRDLLSYSRVLHPEGAPAAAANLDRSLAEAIAVLRDRIEGSHACITSDPLPHVRGDEKQLTHVFQNLLSNAIKYRQTSLAPVIRVSAERRGSEWVIHLQDNGIGFDKAYADQVFGLFKRLHRDEYPGNGLGLAICKRIIERYNGSMWATSQPDVGSTFSFALSALEV